MQIEVLYFGVLKDKLGTRQSTVQLADGSDVSTLLTKVRSVAQQESIFKSIAVAVNREYATLQTILADGDEVALLPPVSGGSVSYAH